MPNGGTSKLNIVGFNREPAFYYKLYGKYAEAGSYGDALFYLKKAVALSGGAGEYMVELARLYARLSRFEQSNAIYFKLLSQGQEHAKSYFGLSQNLYFLSDIEHSVYYLNLYMDKYGQELPYLTDDEEDYIEIAEEEDDFSGYKIVWPPEERDETELLAAAKDYMKSGLFQKAAQLLLTVKQGNPDYIFARNNLALCSFFLGNYKQTEVYSKEVLAAEPQNVFALCNMAAMHGYLGEIDKCNKYVERITAINADNMPDMFKIATTFCELKLHGPALEYLLKILEEKPYDSNIMFLTGIAYYNNRMTGKAEDMFLQLLRLNDNDHSAKYYLDYIARIKKEDAQEDGFFQPLDYICQVPYSEMLERIKSVKQGLKITRAQALKLSDSQMEHFLDLCDWCFSITDPVFQQGIVKGLMSKYFGGRSQEFLREKLLAAEVPLAVKKLIIELFVLRRISTPYKLNADCVIKSLTPVLCSPPRTLLSYYGAYAMAYAHAAVSRAEGMEEDIYAAYKRVYSAALAHSVECKNKAVVAAVILYVSKSVRTVKLQKSICAMFKVSHTAFSHMLKQLGL